MRRALRLGAAAGASTALALCLSACLPGQAGPAAPLAGASPGASTPPAVAARTSAAPRSAPPPRETIAGKIAYAADGGLWVYDGSTTHQVVNVPGTADPAWSPDGARLAFDKQDKNSAELYVMPYPQGPPKALANNASRVVENNLWDMQPDWSGDGLALAYVSDRGRLRNGVLDPAAWRITLASGARVQLTGANQYSGGVDFPRWRPRRPGQLLYTSWAYDPQSLDPYGQLVLEDTQTGRREALSPAGQTSFQPAWSPEGDHIAFIKREGKRDDLWIMPVAADNGPAPPAEPDQAGARSVAQGMAAHPAWSPDGQAIAYVALKDGSFDLFVQPLSASLEPEGQPRQLTHGAHLNAASSISWGR